MRKRLKWKLIFFGLKYLSIPIIILGIVIFMMLYNASGEWLELYDSLSAKVDDSKLNFDKRLYFVTTKEDGSKVVTVGFQSETEYEAFQQKFADVIDDGVEGNIDDIDDYDSDPTYGDPISTELETYVNNNYTMWTCHNNEGKQKTLSALYYTLTNAGISKECIAGIQGNVMHEGKSGQFEKIPYGNSTHDYYKNSWENSAIYNQFPSRSGISQDKIYSEVFSNKQAFNVSMTYVELYSMFGITVSSGKNIFGFGPLQATSGGWHSKYMTAMENLNLHTSTNGILYADILAIDSEVSKIGAIAHFSNGIPSEGNNLTKKGNTYNAVITAVTAELGPLTNSEKDVVKASAYWTACVEVCSGYGQLDTLKERAISSVRAYRCMD